MAAALPLLDRVSRAVIRGTLLSLRAAHRRCPHSHSELFARPIARRVRPRAAKSFLAAPIPIGDCRQSVQGSSRRRFLGGGTKLQAHLNLAPLPRFPDSPHSPPRGGPVRTTFSRAPLLSDSEVGRSVSQLSAAVVDLEIGDEDGYREAPELDEEEEEEEPAHGSRDHGTEERLVANEKMLQINKADFTVSSLLDKISRAKLNLKPAYQRDYVWDKKTASKLIESLLLNIPVPTMFFHEKERGKLEVVDGKQRLTSIWSFIVEERFPDGTPFALTGLEVLRKLNGLMYSDLNDDLKESLQDYALNVHTISRHSDEDVVFEVFERLNMGSTQLNEQELRNCIYQGTYNSLLEDLVLDGYMLLAMHADVPHKRMRDRELLLRFFALRTSGVEGFMLPVKTWLNEQMRHNMDVSTQEAAAMKADFERSIRLAVEVFGQDHVFRVLRPGVRKADEPKWDSEVNVALWDTIMYGFLHFRDDDAILAARGDIKKALMDMMTKDVDFRRALVSSRKALKIRCHKWNKALGKVLGSPPVRD